MKKGLLFILCLTLGASTTYGNTLIKGNISNSYPYLFQEPTYSYVKYGYTPFPSKEYISPIITVNNLAYAENTPDHQPVDLARYKSLNATAKLSLEYFNSKTGAYRFKLSLTPKYFNDHSVSSMISDKNNPPQSKLLWIKFNNNKTYLYIDGLIDIGRKGKNNLPASIHTREGSEFTFSLDEYGQIVLIPARKISVVAAI